MRISAILTALFPAVRQEILAATLLSPEKSWYLSELAAHLGTSPSSLQRELEALARSGILRRRQEGRRIYYRAETTSPVFVELRELFSKTAGVVPLLHAELEAFGPKIRWAAIYGSIARGEERAQSDVDLLIVGLVTLQDLLPALRRVERQFGREVNVTRYSEEEFRAKRHSGNHFLDSILKSNLITIAGSPDELEKTAGRRQSSRTQSKKKELDELRAVIARDLEDAAIQELSDDRRFATAYNAALQAAKMAILCAGYQLASTPGHHRLAFEAAQLALGASATRLLDFFEACRRKRNVIDYDHASVATHTEAEEIVAEANDFFELVERWIASNHPKLIP